MDTLTVTGYNAIKRVETMLDYQAEMDGVVVQFGRSVGMSDEYEAKPDIIVTGGSYNDVGCFPEPLVMTAETELGAMFIELVLAPTGKDAS